MFFTVGFLLYKQVVMQMKQDHMYPQKVLLTGASGFLGGYILPALQTVGHQVNTLGRNKSNEIIADLSITAPRLSNTYYDAVIHAAGLAHVDNKTAALNDRMEEVNFTGTKHLCAAIDLLEKTPKVFIFISTVAVYGLVAGEMINEMQALHPSTAYGQSKAKAEVFLTEWCTKKGILLCILRLPLLVGTNAPGTLGAMVDAISNGKYFNIGGGKAQKSMVLAKDVADLLAQLPEVPGVFHLTDGQPIDFATLANYIAQHFGKPKIRNLPTWLAKIAAVIGDFMGSKSPINTERLQKLTATLTFDDQKAKELLAWQPTSVLQGYVP